MGRIGAKLMAYELPRDKNGAVYRLAVLIDFEKFDTANAIDAFDVVIKSVRKEERERCAEACIKERIDNPTTEMAFGHNGGCHSSYEAIRALGDK